MCENTIHPSLAAFLTLSSLKPLMFAMWTFSSNDSNDNIQWINLQTVRRLSETNFTFFLFTLILKHNIVWECLAFCSEKNDLGVQIEPRESKPRVLLHKNWQTLGRKLFPLTAVNVVLLIRSLLKPISDKRASCSFQSSFTYTRGTSSPPCTSVGSNSLPDVQKYGNSVFSAKAQCTTPTGQR